MGEQQTAGCSRHCRHARATADASSRGFARCLRELLTTVLPATLPKHPRQMAAVLQGGCLQLYVLVRISLAVHQQDIVCCK